MQQIRNSDKLTRAMKSLEDTINYARTANFQEADNSFKNIIHAAVVQNFNLTLNVCLKMLKSQLQNIPEYTNHIHSESDESIILAAAQENLISNPHNWIEFLNCQFLSNTTNTPLRTYEKATNFLENAKELLTTCQKRKFNERRVA